MTPVTGGRLEGTRREILGILRRRGGCSVDELAADLELAGATVRRHLDVLQRDNYVAVSQDRGRTGRPRHIFTLTEAGFDLFPQHYVRLTHRLVEEIAALDASETSGRAGHEIADLVFEKMATRLAREFRPRITGFTLADRVRSAAALMQDEGIDFDVEPVEGGVRMLGRGCPCLRIGAHEDHAACDHDRQMLEQVLEARVEPLPPVAIPSDFLCGYLVRERDGAPPGG